MRIVSTTYLMFLAACVAGVPTSAEIQEIGQTHCEYVCSARVKDGGEMCRPNTTNQFCIDQCEAGDPGLDWCPAACVASALGDPCGSGIVCNSGLTCRQAEGGSFCTEVACDWGTCHGDGICALMQTGPQTWETLCMPSCDNPCPTGMVVEDDIRGCICVPA